MTPAAPPPRTYRDYLKPRAGFPLPFADRQSAYAIARDRRALERRVEGSGYCG